MSEPIKNPMQQEKEKSERKTTIRESAANIARNTGKSGNYSYLRNQVIGRATDLARTTGLMKLEKKYKTIADIKILTPEQIIDIPFHELSKKMYKDVRNSSLNERQKLALECRLYQRRRVQNHQKWNENECYDALKTNIVNKQSFTKSAANTVLNSINEEDEKNMNNKYRHGGKKYTRRKTRSKMRKSKRKRHKKRSTRRR